MDKLRFLTESRNGESSSEKLIHKDNSSSNRISCSIGEKSDIKRCKDVCFSRQQWMTEQGLNYVLCKDNRKFYRTRPKTETWYARASQVKVMGFCVVEDHDIMDMKDFSNGFFVYVYDCNKTTQDVRTSITVLGHTLNAVMEFYGKSNQTWCGRSQPKTRIILWKRTWFQSTEQSRWWGRRLVVYWWRKSNNTLLQIVHEEKLNKTPSGTLLQNYHSIRNGLYILHETKGVFRWRMEIFPTMKSGGILISKMVFSLSCDGRNTAYGKERILDYVVNRTQVPNDLDSDSEKIIR